MPKPKRAPVKVVLSRRAADKLYRAVCEAVGGIAFHEGNCPPADDYTIDLDAATCAALAKAIVASRGVGRAPKKKQRAKK